MWILQVVSAIWKMWNGKKFDTGLAITVLALIFQQVFAKYGADHDTAVTFATYIVQAVGAVLVVIGWIHRRIKELQAKKK